VNRTDLEGGFVSLEGAAVEAVHRVREQVGAPRAQVGMIVVGAAIHAQHVAHSLALKFEARTIGNLREARGDEMVTQADKEHMAIVSAFASYQVRSGVRR
jgi:hypothetical protein